MHAVSAKMDHLIPTEILKFGKNQMKGIRWALTARTAKIVLQVRVPQVLVPFLLKGAVSTANKSAGRIEFDVWSKSREETKCLKQILVLSRKGNPFPPS